jgi:preprotein translocase subunit SecG
MLDAFFYLTLVLFLLVCLILILLILIQKGRGGGLASAFGGGGGNTAFGSKTGDVLTWATSVVFGVFLVLAVALNLIGNRMNPANAAAVPAVTAGSGSENVTGDVAPQNADGTVDLPSNQAAGAPPAVPATPQDATIPLTVPPEPNLTVPAPAPGPISTPAAPTTGPSVP